MAKKSEPLFGCSACGATTSRWAGRCPSCGAMNSMSELAALDAAMVRAANSAPSASTLTPAIQRPLQVARLGEVAAWPARERLSTGLGELDRVLGGGLPRGGAIVIGGAPGVGKSTILAQVAGSVACQAGVLYVTAEESLEQIRARCLRLGLSDDNPHLELAAGTDAAAIAGAIGKGQHALVVVDSIQLVTRSDVDGAAGTPSQVRGCAALLVEAAKHTGTTLVLVGHVTKDGTLAGPRLLEHIVDCVLALEGDHYQDLRCLRAVKNRFGSTCELGLLTMDAQGLHDVADPAGLFISGRKTDIPGSAISPFLDGQRCLLVEIQALVCPTRGEAPPLRKVAGLDHNRVALILAVLSRRLSLPLGSCDVFVSAAGGIEVREPAADLAIALAIASAWADVPLPPDAAFLGEIGLGGELRPVGRYDLRAQEARKLGFQRLCGPGTGQGRGRLKVESLREAHNLFFSTTG